VKLEPVEATTGADARLVEAVDGIETQGNGWVVPQATPQKGVFRCVPPMEAGRIRTALVFESGQKDAFFCEFSISATTDPNPSLAGHWQSVFPISFNAEKGWLQRAYPHLEFLDHPSRTKVFLSGVLPDDRVTGIRVEAWPSKAGLAGNAILTELRMERLPMGSTNVALGCPATASQELGPKQYAEFLTDGLAGSYVHPAAQHAGPDFYYEIDLRRSRDLDHISLRSLAQGGTTVRFHELHLQLFNEEPSSDTAPVWEGSVRESVPVPEPGAIGVVRAADGEGMFRGRYLRIFSTSNAPFAPQIAEVEVYESLTPTGIQVWANDRPVTGAKVVRVAADTNWLTFALEQPSLRDGLKLGARWRLAGKGDEWLPANSKGNIETRGLPPGEYLFEAQLRHTDMEWNSTSIRLPVIVLAPWWKNPWAQWTAAFALSCIAALLAWRIARRRVIELERRQELSRERARIARDMHDVVGARLTQLTVMHELFAARNALPTDAANQLHELTSTARATVSALDEAVWAINPRNDTLQNVADYLCHTAADYLRLLEISLRQHVPEAWPPRTVLSQKRHELLLAFKEALQNIAKHSGAKVATLTLRFEEPEFVVYLDDDGCGLPSNPEGDGKDGLENMRTRLTHVGGSCTVQTRPEGGTRVEIHLPV
jgi:signal transduction histidine kinase